MGMDGGPLWLGNSRCHDKCHFQGRLLIINVLFGRYYEGGVSSVYFWDLDDGFAGVVLLKKSG